MTIQRRSLRIAVTSLICFTLCTGETAPKTLTTESQRSLTTHRESLPELRKLVFQMSRKVTGQPQGKTVPTQVMSSKRSPEIARIVREIDARNIEQRELTCRLCPLRDLDERALEVIARRSQLGLGSGQVRLPKRDSLSSLAVVRRAQTFEGLPARVDSVAC